MATVHRISEEFFDDSFGLIALHSNMECYALAYNLNKAAKIMLVRSEDDLEIDTSHYPMFEFKDDEYIKNTIKNGFKEFFKYRILPFDLPSNTPIYFIGSIAHYFRDTLEKVAGKYDYTITDVIQRPIDNLIDYHRVNL